MFTVFFAIDARPSSALAAALLVAVTSCGCRSTEKLLAPSQHRDWDPLYSVLPQAEFRGQQVTVRGVRNCHYIDRDCYVLDWYDKTFDVGAVQALDFVVMPFRETPTLAHTQLSFEIASTTGSPEYLVVSAETRRERGETYSPLKGSARQFELMYVVADERDSIQLQTDVHDRDVYLYRSTATPEQARRLFVDVMGRVNQLASRPEFYDTLTNNCTTNIIDHVNRVMPRRVAYDYRVLLPGLSDQLAYEQGLIERHGSFAETRAKAYVNFRAGHLASHDDFSRRIRR